MYVQNIMKDIMHEDVRSTVSTSHACAVWRERVSKENQLREQSFEKNGYVSSCVCVCVCRVHLFFLCHLPLILCLCVFSELVHYAYLRLFMFLCVCVLK